MSLRAKIEKQASSKTLNKSIGELGSILNAGMFPRSHSMLRARYHRKLKELLEEVALGWYKLGFKRCHKTLYRRGKTVERRVARRMTMHSRLFNTSLEIDLESIIPRR
jgi:hypothetical protein